MNDLLHTFIMPKDVFFLHFLTINSELLKLYIKETSEKVSFIPLRLKTTQKQK
jgi:hypothetical protein